METRARVASLEGRMRQALAGWSLRAVVAGLIALRGVDVVTAMTVRAELGDITRFDSPRELMSFQGLVPSEHSCGPRRQGGDHQDGRRACAPGAGGVGLVLPVPGTQDPAPAAQGGSGPAGGAGICQGGAEAAVYAVSASLPLRQGAVRGDHRGGARAGGVPLGDCLRGDGPGPRDAGAELRDGRSSPPLAHRFASINGARRPGQDVENCFGACRRRFHLRLHGRQVTGKCSVFDSGRGRPVRRTLGRPMSGLVPTDRPTSLDRGRSATK